MPTSLRLLLLQVILPTVLPTAAALTTHLVLLRLFLEIVHVELDVAHHATCRHTSELPFDTKEATGRHSLILQLQLEFGRH